MAIGMHSAHAPEVAPKSLKGDLSLPVRGCQERIAKKNIAEKERVNRKGPLWWGPFSGEHRPSLSVQTSGALPVMSGALPVRDGRVCLGKQPFSQFLGRTTSGAFSGAITSGAFSGALPVQRHIPGVKGPRL